MRAIGIAATPRLSSITPRAGELKQPMEGSSYCCYMLLTPYFYRSSLFFNALYTVLNGGIDFSRRSSSSKKDSAAGRDEERSEEDSCTVQVDDVFVELRDRMAKAIDKLNSERRAEIQEQNAAAQRVYSESVSAAAVPPEATATADAASADVAEKTKKKKKKDKKAAVIASPELKVFVPVPAQDPVLFLPSDLSICSAALRNPVCFRASLPPSPGKPFAVKIGDTFVMLEWEQLEFDGAPTTRYDIYMKNESRLYSDWKLVPNACNIPHAGLYTRFTVNHLPIGVRTEFRIVGFNCSGPSPPSKVSVKVCPGENLVPLGSEHRWRRVAAGGPMAVLDIMEHNPKIRNDVLGGFRLMIAFAQKTGGFQRTAVQMRGATLACAAISTYPDDLRVISGALIVLGYCFLGASSFQDGKNSSMLYSMYEDTNVPKIILERQLVYSSNPLFVAAVMWARRCGVGGLPVFSNSESIEAEKNEKKMYNIFLLHADDIDADA